MTPKNPKGLGMQVPSILHLLHNPIDDSSGVPIPMKPPAILDHFQKFMQFHNGKHENRLGTQVPAYDRLHHSRFYRILLHRYILCTKLHHTILILDNNPFEPVSIICDWIVLSEEPTSGFLSEARGLKEHLC